MQEQEPVYREILREEFSRRSKRNSRYSVRSFARTLQLDSGALSQILAGKRIPSVTVAKKIAERLTLSPEYSAEFFNSLADVHCARKLQRTRKFFKDIVFEKAKQKAARSNPQYRDLNSEMFRTISDWYHYAILELTFVKGFSSDPKWVAKELGISSTEVYLAIDRLKHLGFLQDENGKLVKSTPPLMTEDRSTTSAAHKRRQKQILEKAIQALDDVPLELRNHSAMTMAIDTAKIPAAKKRIQIFLNDLTQFLESGSQKQVYEASVCLFPLQKIQKENL